MNPQSTVPGTQQQQAIDRLKTAVNVLVTVSNNPTVDQLAAAIGFTLALNKLGKHATAVFSGDVPSTIEFLKPESTIEKTTDSLRDFIVSLDKSKADKLRYKVEQNVVKIFITPYRTSLSEKDLEFSQGDFNVDAVVALGVTEREQLDQAIIAHGRILHDATVITVSAGPLASTLGAINWQDQSASSLCEMVIAAGDALQPGLLDNQIATAYLTGIVAQTERFRNEKTTPKVMTISAQLMAAGANQQLIADQLEKTAEVELQPAIPASAMPAAPVVPEAPQVKVAKAADDGSLTIDHENPKLPSLGDGTMPPDTNPDEILIDEHGNMSTLEAERKAEEAAKAKAEADAKAEAEAAEAEKADENQESEQAEAEKPEKKPRHRVIAPLPSSGEDDSSPTGGRVSNPYSFAQGVASDDGLDEPFVDPLTSAGPEPAPAAEEEAPSTGQGPDAVLPPSENEPIVPPASTVTPTIIGDTPDENVATLPPAMDDNTLRDIEKNVSSPHITKDPNSTLGDIEEAVNSPHLTDVNGLDSARDAVQSAMSAAPYDPTRPEPLQALNAMPLSTPAAPTSSDPVLAGLGLSDNVPPQQDGPILPPAPEQSQQPQPTTEEASPSAPPVPPPFPLNTAARG